MSDDDIQSIWHQPAIEPRPKPVAPRPAPVISQVRPTPPPSRPMLDAKVGDRITVTRAGRDRIAIVRTVDGDHVSIDFDPPLPYPAPVGSYMAVRVRRDEITRILPKTPPPDPKLIRLR